MSGRRWAAVRTEKGVGMVEAALVLPLLVLFLLAMIDIGLGVFQTTQAEAAARDGARAGTVHHRQGDIATSTDAAAIRSAVVRRVGASPFGHPLSIQIRCVGATNTVPLTGGCAAATTLTHDRIEVTVTWDRPPMSFVTAGFSGARTVVGRGVMAIQERPPGAGAEL